MQNHDIDSIQIGLRIQEARRRAIICEYLEEQLDLLRKSITD